MAKSASKGSLTGTTFLFTGTLQELTRVEAENLVKDNGGSVLSGVTEKLNYLVVGEDAGSKLEKARKIKSIKVLKERDFLKMIKGTAKSDPAGTKPKSDKVSSRQGSPVKTIKIGTQIWMVDNLEVSQFRNGDLIPEVKTAKAWEKATNEGKPAWCYYQNDPANGKKYGKLYNWYAVNDPRGLAPEGWHVPTDNEWTSLFDILGGEQEYAFVEKYYLRSKNIYTGEKLKSIDGWEEWCRPKDGEMISGGGTNESGFSGFPGGVRESWGFSGDRTEGNWWSATAADISDGGGAWKIILSYDPQWQMKYGLRKTSSKGVGLSVRCIKD